MDPVIAAHSQLLAVQSTLISKALGSLTEEETWRRPTAETNSVGWLVGHIVLYRHRMLAALGGDAETVAWGPVFQRGAQVADRSAYPPTADLTGALKRVNEQLKARMEAVTDAELSAAAPVSSPLPDKSVRGVVTFLVFHDGYHVGQIAYAMKLLGKAGLVG